MIVNKDLTNKKNFKVVKIECFRVKRMVDSNLNEECAIKSVWNGANDKNYPK